MSAARAAWLSSDVQPGSVPTAPFRYNLCGDVELRAKLSSQYHVIYWNSSPIRADRRIRDLSAGGWLCLLSALLAGLRCGSLTFVRPSTANWIAIAISTVAAMAAIASATAAFLTVRDERAATFVAERNNCSNILIQEIDRYYNLSLEVDPRDATFKEYGFLWTSGDRVASSCIQNGLIPNHSDLAVATSAKSSELADEWQSRSNYKHNWKTSERDFYKRGDYWIRLLRADLAYVNGRPIPLPFDIPQPSLEPSPTAPA